jgi:hypothetical protein
LDAGVSVKAAGETSPRLDDVETILVVTAETMQAVFAEISRGRRVWVTISR